MASGRTHQSINIAIFVGASVLVAAALHRGWGQPWTNRIGLEWPAVFAFTGAFLAGTYLVTPDLDLAEQHVLAKRNWGRLGAIWVPYGYLFSHRGVSHGWFFGPLTRIAYLLTVGALAIVIVYGVANLAEYPLPRPKVPTSLRMEWLWLGGGALVGFYISQWLHLLADGVGPLHGLRRLFRKLSGR